MQRSASNKHCNTVSTAVFSFYTARLYKWKQCSKSICWLSTGGQDSVRIHSCQWSDRFYKREEMLLVVFFYFIILTFIRKYLLGNKLEECSDPLIFPRLSLQAMPSKGSDIIAVHSFISTAEGTFGPGCLIVIPNCKFFPLWEKENQIWGLCSVRALNLILLHVIIRLHSFSQWHRQESDFLPVIKCGWWVEGLASLKGPDVRTV